MSDEHSGPWTISALKEHIDSRLKSMEKAVDVALAAKHENRGMIVAAISLIVALAALMVAVLKH